MRAALGDEDTWARVAEPLVSSFGGALHEGLGITDDEVGRHVRSQIEPLLTLSFGEVNLGALLIGPAGAQEPTDDRRQRSWRATARHLRENRRIRRHIAAAGDGTVAEFDRGVFLLAKQLLYFERYGKMFLSDTALLEDEGFFRAALDDTDDSGGAK